MKINDSKAYLITGSCSKEIEKKCIELLISIYPNEKNELIKTKKNINCIWCYPSGIFYKKQDIDEAIYNLNLEQNNIPFSIIVHHAERLTSFVSQLFLKIIEEMSEKKYIFFLAEDLKNIPKTIISRCIIINLKNENIKLITKKHKDFADLFIENKINPEEIDILIEKYEIDEVSSKKIFFYINQKLNEEKKKILPKDIIDIYKKPILTNMHKICFKILFMFLNKNK